MIQHAPGNGTRIPGDPLADEVGQALSRAVPALLALQRPDGNWYAELESNVTSYARHTIIPLTIVSAVQPTTRLRDTDPRPVTALRTAWPASPCRVHYRRRTRAS